MTNAELQVLRANEQAVLGGVLNNTYDAATIDLAPEHLLDYRAQIAWEAILELEQAKRPVDVITVETEIVRVLKSREHADDWVIPYLADCVLQFPDVDTAKWYASQLRTAWFNQQCLQIFGEALAKGQRGEVEGEELAAFAVTRLEQLQQVGAGDGTKNAGQVLRARFDQIKEEIDNQASGKFTASVLPSGIAPLDAKIKGFPVGQLTIVGGRPAMGKSVFGITITHSTASLGHGVHVFSLEDTEETYANRLLARITGVPVDKFLNCDFNHGDIAALAANKSRIEALRKNWLIDGTEGLKVDDICLRVRRHKKNNGIEGTKLVIVDYLQLVGYPAWMARDSEPQRLNYVIQQLANLAKAEKLAVVLLAQINRGVESSDDKRPSQSDFKGTGGIEEKAKLLIALFRGSEYGPPVQGIDYQGMAPSDKDWQSAIEMHVLKFTAGRPGIVHAHWDGAIARIQ